MDSNADIITRSDLLYLIETIEKAAQLKKIAVPTEVFIFMVRNCLELVSRLIDPDMAEQWENLRDHEVGSSGAKSSKKKKKKWMVTLMSGL